MFWATPEVPSVLVMLRSADGAPPATVSVSLADRSVQAKHYHIDRGNGRSYEVWIDNAGTVVKFSLVNTNATIAFTLDR